MPVAVVLWSSTSKPTDRPRSAPSRMRAMASPPRLVAARMRPVTDSPTGVSSADDDLPDLLLPVVPVQDRGAGEVVDVERAAGEGLGHALVDDLLLEGDSDAVELQRAVVAGADGVRLQGQVSHWRLPPTLCSRSGCAAPRRRCGRGAQQRVDGVLDLRGERRQGSSLLKRRLLSWLFEYDRLEFPPASAMPKQVWWGRRTSLQRSASCRCATRSTRPLAADDVVDVAQSGAEDRDQSQCSGFRSRCRGSGGHSRR